MTHPPSPAAPLALDLADDGVPLSRAMAWLSGVPGGYGSILLDRRVEVQEKLECEVDTKAGCATLALGEQMLVPVVPNPPPSGAVPDVLMLVNSTGRSSKAGVGPPPATTLAVLITEGRWIWVAPMPVTGTALHSWMQNAW